MTVGELDDVELFFVRGKVRERNRDGGVVGGENDGLGGGGVGDVEGDAGCVG